nr:hypothetical protein [Pandoraea cepalis]
MQSRRDRHAAKRLMRKLLRKHLHAPRRTVSICYSRFYSLTAGYQNVISYGRALPMALSRVVPYSNYLKH